MTIKIIKTVDAECIKKANEKFAELHEENAHLQAIMNEQRGVLKMCLSKLQREYDDGTGKISNLIYIQSIKEALALTKPTTVEEKTL